MQGSGIEVRCYSAHRYAQEPREVLWLGHWRPIAEVRKRWLWPGQSGFEVVLDDGSILEIVYDELSDAWEGKPRRSSAPSGPPPTPPARDSD